MIGIVAKTLAESYDTVGCMGTYFDYFRQFGDCIIIPPMKPESFKSILPILNLLVLPGGEDVDTRNYGEPPLAITGRPNHFFEWFDNFLLPVALEAKLPVFGICRGLQTLNVAFGGTLFQDIVHPVSTYRTQDAHAVKTEKPLALKLRVNSMHHQAICKLGEGLEAIAWSDDNFIEAIMHQSLPVAGVQWHPEEICDQYTYKLVNTLLGKKG